MAKRKRLSPAPMVGPDTGPATGSTPGPAPSDAAEGWPRPAPRRGAPIADVAGDASGRAAAEEMAAALQSAREEGRMVVALPLDRIHADYLVRDRMGVDDEEMSALKASIAARGQQTPVEVARTPDGYGLISGWRRLAALRALHAETGDARFAAINALLRRPQDSAEAYLAMVEENEIRAGLSYYERARIVTRAVEQGVFPDDRAALQTLFAAASRPRRSKIGSFVVLVVMLDGALRFPRAIGERLGLRLARAVEEDPDLAPRLRADLTARPPETPDEEQTRLDAAIAFGGPGVAPPPAERAAPPAPVSRAKRSSPAPGVTLTGRDGRLVLSGAGVDAALRDRLEAWLRDTS